MMKNSLPGRALRVLSGRWGEGIAATMASFCLRLAALAPLLALALGEDAGAKWIALITPVLILFIILPLRFSEAGALRDYWEGGAYATGRLISLDRYGVKLRLALRHALQLLLWALPLLALLGYAAYLYFTKLDIVTFLRMLVSLGMAVSGSTASSVDAIFTAIGVIALVVALALLILHYGAVRLSLVRHVWAMDEGQSPQMAWRGAKTMLRGKRRLQWAQMGVSLACFLPFYIALVITTYQAAVALMVLDFSGLKPLVILCGALFAACGAISMPLRRLMPKAVLERLTAGAGAQTAKEA